MPGYDRALYQLYLSRVPMFSTCTSEQLDRLAELGEELSPKEGSDIIREGDAADAFYVMTSGSASVTRGGKDIALLAPGDYFGELSLFDPMPRNSTITAGPDTSCVKLSRAAFTQALNEVPTVRDTLLHGMAHRIHVLDQRV